MDQCLNTLTIMRGRTWVSTLSTMHWKMKPWFRHKNMYVCTHEKLHGPFIYIYLQTSEWNRSKRHSIYKFKQNLFLQVDRVLNLVSPLVSDQNDQPVEEEDLEDFAEEQGMMGRLVQLLQAEDADQQYLVRNCCRILLLFYFAKLNEILDQLYYWGFSKFTLGDIIGKERVMWNCFWICRFWTLRENILVMEETNE